MRQPSQSGPFLSAVVPCYNEEASLPELHRRLSAALAAATPDYEIVLINDGSRDQTWPVLCSLAVTDPHLVCVNLSRNHGHQLALSAGLSLCRGQRILVVDADLQDPPELLPQLMQLMDQGADVVYGQRMARDGESVFKKLSAWMFYRLLNFFTEVDIPKDAGDFRLMSRRVLDVFNSMPENFRFIRGMISWVGFKQVPLQYHRPPRAAGETQYTLAKMLRFAFDGITSFSVRPLRFAPLLRSLAVCWRTRSAGLHARSLLSNPHGAWMDQSDDGGSALQRAAISVSRVDRRVSRPSLHRSQAPPVIRGAGCGSR